MKHKRPKLLSLTRVPFCSGVPVNADVVSVSQHAQNQDPETAAAEQNSAIAAFKHLYFSSETSLDVTAGNISWKHSDKRSLPSSVVLLDVPAAVAFTRLQLDEPLVHGLQDGRVHLLHDVLQLVGV